MKHVLLGVVDELNKEKNLMIGLALATANKRKVVKLKHKYPPEEGLSEEELYHYFYQPIEQHGDQRQKATDLN